MYVAILFGVFNDFAIKSPVGALTEHGGICEVAAEHSRGLVGDFRRFSVDVWCLNWVKKKKKIEHNTFINIPSNKQHWLQMHHCHWLLIRYSYNLHLDLDTQQLSLKEKKKKKSIWHDDITGRENDRKHLQKKKKKLYTSCEKFPVVLLDYSNESNNSTSQFRDYNIKML